MSPADRSSSGPGELGAGGTLLRLWSERWRADPDRPVLISGEDPAAVLSHQALAELTAGAAAVLAARGVAAGDRVLWCRSPSLDSIVGLLGALRLGAVVVPLNPRSAGGELSYVVGDVRLPSGIVMEHGDLTVLQAIAMAQGTNPSASLNHAKLIRRSGDKPQELSLALKKILAARAPDVKLQPEDIVFVPSSASKGIAKRSAETALQLATGLAIYGRW